MFFAISSVEACQKSTVSEVINSKLNTRAKLTLATIIGDTFVSITCLVIGILRLVSVLHGIPPAASYALLGISGVITLTWLLLSIGSKGAVIKFTKNLIVAAISDNSENPNFRIS
jgi:hypothetical protein